MHRHILYVCLFREGVAFGFKLSVGFYFCREGSIIFQKHIYFVSRSRIQDESVRWLLMNGKTEKAERILRKAAKWNKVNFDDVISTDVVHVDNLDKLSRELEGTEMSKENIQEVDHVENSGSVKSDRDDNGFTVERYSVITILRNKYILKNSMIMWFTWYAYTILNFEYLMGFFWVRII